MSLYKGRSLQTDSDRIGITTAQAAAIKENSEKVGITTAQADAITANSDKVGITTAQANAIAANAQNLDTKMPKAGGTFTGTVYLEQPLVSQAGISAPLLLCDRMLPYNFLQGNSNKLEVDYQDVHFHYTNGTGAFACDLTTTLSDLLIFDSGTWGDAINFQSGLQGQAPNRFKYSSTIAHAFGTGTAKSKIEFKFGYVDHPTAGTSTTTRHYIGWNGFSAHTSDDRLKHDEESITTGLAVMAQLDPQKYRKTFVLNDPDGPSQLEAGFIAQEVLQTDLAFAVQDGDTEEGEEPYRLDYNSVFTYAVAAIKELEALVNSQSSEIAALKERVSVLEN